VGAMPTVAVCLLLGFTPTEHAKVDRVDLVEINHFFDEQGRLVFDQLIFYDWCAVQNRYNVRDWRLLKSPAQIPVRNWKDRDFVAVWHDFKERDVLRKVVAKMMRETWTQYDPELVEREFLPQEKRRELSKPVAVAKKRAAASQTRVRTSEPAARQVTRPAARQTGNMPPVTPPTTQQPTRGCSNP
jgi:hypothetical protein